MKKLLPITILLLASFQTTYTAENKLDMQLIFDRNTETLKNALDQGADVDYVVASGLYKGTTPIYEAVQCYIESSKSFSDDDASEISFAITEALLDQGLSNSINHACPDAYTRNFKKISPLGMAIWHYCSHPFFDEDNSEDTRYLQAKTLIKELIRHGADINEISCQKVFELLPQQFNPRMPQFTLEKIQARMAKVRAMYNEHKPKKSMLKLDFAD